MNRRLCSTLMVAWLDKCGAGSNIAAGTRNLRRSNHKEIRKVIQHTTPAKQHGGHWRSLRHATKPTARSSWAARPRLLKQMASLHKSTAAAPVRRASAHEHIDKAIMSVQLLTCAQACHDFNQNVALSDVCEVAEACSKIMFPTARNTQRPA